MANKKISALTAAATLATGDPMPIVDISDTTDAATGTTKKTTIANMSASGSEVDTGTSEIKFVTPKSLADSTYVPTVAPGTSGNVMTSNGTTWTSSQRAVALTLIPQSPLPITPLADSGVADLPAISTAMSTNTTAYVGQIVVPFPITVNKISIMVGDVNVAGTLDLTVYSENGQTQEIAVTTATISAAGIVTTAVSAVALEAGVHYLMVNTNGTANISNYLWNTRDKAPFGATNGLDEDISSEPVIQGNLTITAGTPPATFTPSAITGARPATLVCRLDN